MVRINYLRECVTVKLFNSIRAAIKDNNIALQYNHKTHQKGRAFVSNFFLNEKGAGPFFFLNSYLTLKKNIIFDQSSYRTIKPKKKIILWLKILVFYGDLPHHFYSHCIKISILLLNGFNISRFVDFGINFFFLLICWIELNNFKFLEIACLGFYKSLYIFIVFLRKKSKVIVNAPMQWFSALSVLLAMYRLTVFF